MTETCLVIWFNSFLGCGYMELEYCFKKMVSSVWARNIRSLVYEGCFLISLSPMCRLSMFMFKSFSSLSSLSSELPLSLLFDDTLHLLFEPNLLLPLPLLCLLLVGGCKRLGFSWPMLLLPLESCIVSFGLRSLLALLGSRFQNLGFIALFILNWNSVDTDRHLCIGASLLKPRRVVAQFLGRSARFFFIAITMVLMLPSLANLDFAGECYC